ncbi:MAG: Peptidyl-tRNA hydrolase [Parcubacteria group bacterium GW2011_GWA2_42_11]|nr:MAG: Peptidyl-tRNA hydrolase [Parcubacteria group bacterium GW2011_GWA2_42_11]KKT76470.1 MAG: Peptidyl-tRNA hydrolase [Parcubacteria group bacterium GW2011_GWF2_44_7]
MKLIIGLGNPGSKYEKTRHNLGFAALDYFKNNNAGFSDWREDKKFNALLSESSIGSEEKIILAKPQTFMNLSGQTVRTLADFYKMSAADIWIIHDDMALPLGTLRISQNSSAGGHNGVESIIKNLGTKDFVRFRLGIHPIGQTFLACVFKRLISTQKFVLQKFAKNELAAIEAAQQKTAEALSAALGDGLPAAMNKFN